MSPKHTADAPAWPHASMLGRSGGQPMHGSTHQLHDDVLCIALLPLLSLGDGLHRFNDLDLQG